MALTGWWMAVALAAGQPADDEATQAPADPEASSETEAAPGDPEAGDPTEAQAEAPADTPEDAPADAPPDPPTAQVTTATADDEEVSEYRWGGIGLPLVNYNTTDKLGFGAGFEVYDRKVGETGYRNRLSVSTFWTTSGNYGSNYLQYERRGKVLLVTRFTYRLWKNMIYVGSGGDDVSVSWDPDDSMGNSVQGPQLFGSVMVPVRNTPVYLWAQAYLRYTLVDAKPGGILDQTQAFGIDGGFYFDVSAGLLINEVDRWPLPNRGIRLEASGRAGGTAAPGGFKGLGGVNLEATGWLPLAGQWLVLGNRLLVDKTWGERPFWEQENLGGQFRDELGYEQPMTGYARSRTRGDGAIALLTELRPYFGKTRHPTVDLGFYLSVFAEAAWLFDKGDPGPFMPTIGVAPELLWQGAVPLRPFISLGWFSDEPGGTRRPVSQIGITLLSPL